MHKFLKMFALSGAGLTLAAMPATVMAQAGAPVDAASQAARMTADQQSAFRAWPADKQQAFEAWPAETQAYFWSLTAERQKMFWALSDSDKVALSQMAEPQRESAWTQIEARTRPSQSG